MFWRRGSQNQPGTRKETEKNKNVFSELCAKHPHRTLDLFCSVCDEVYCRDCRETRSHKCYTRHKLEYISDVAYKFEDSEEFKEYDKDILTLRRKIDRSIEKTKEKMKLSTQLQEEAENRIKQQKETLTELIETHYHDISERNKKMNEDCLTKLKEVIQKISGLKAQFEDNENEINEKRKNLMTILFIAMKRSKKEVERITDELSGLNESNYITRYAFEAGKQTQIFMKKTEDFGSLVEENLDLEREYENSSDQLDKTSDECHSGNVELQSTDTAIRIMNQEQFSNSSKESLNYSSASSEAVSKYEPEYLERKPTARPKPLFHTQFDLSGLDEKKEMYQVLYTYTSDDDKYLSCKEGDTVTVLKKCTDDIYWEAKLKGQLGYIRKDYLEEVVESKQDTSVMDLGSRTYDDDQVFDRTVCDLSPQDVSVPEHEQTIDSTGPTQFGTYSSSTSNKPTVPPRLGSKSSTQMIRQAKERHSLRDPGFVRQTQQEQDKYKVLCTYTTHDEEYHSIKKCSGDFGAEHKGQCGYIRKDHVEEVVETGLNTNFKRELEAKLRSRYSATNM